MNNPDFAAIVRVWHNVQAGTTCLQLVDIATAQEIKLSEATFLIRVSVDEATSTERCYLRHIASGSEAYFQSGGGLQAFFKACLFQPDPTAPATDSQ